ncbi:hypothetical protein HOY80DRAFT_946315 [Tuber brumale]|nr:hypothetical protein HOY80DRAFT_946315 [Tuber brumale]
MPGLECSVSHKWLRFTLGVWFPSLGLGLWLLRGTHGGSSGGRRGLKAFCGLLGNQVRTTMSDPIRQRKDVG